MRKLLAVIDYQNDFVDGALGFAKAKTIDKGIAKLVQEYLASGDMLLFTYDTHGGNYRETREGQALPVEHCIKGSEGHRLYGETQSVFCETCITHHLFEIEKNSFGVPPAALAKVAEKIGDISEILVVGLVTNMCVIANATMLQAQWPEAQVVIDASLCASGDDTLHEKALDVMESLQMRIINRT